MFYAHCLGLGIFCLELDFSSLGVYIHTSILFSCAVAAHLGRAVPLCMQGYSSFHWKGNQPCFPQHQYATRSFPLAEPFSLSQLCPGLVQAARP